MPDAALLEVNGKLYGTTFGGGTNGYGTVFAIASGKETVLHSFNSTDGAHPVGMLIEVNRRLYGTTAYGGTGCQASLGCGVVFRIAKTGKRTIVHSFSGPPDGAYPQGALINVNGKLYGTTAGGGFHEQGTVYSVTTTGHERVLYSFKGELDGAMPMAGLINIYGTLYGTTLQGGGTGSLCVYGCGTVFSVTTSGREAVLHSFSGPPDGSAPYSGLTNVNGTIYGNTRDGGSMTCNCGTVFSIDASGKESVLHRFSRSSDGKYPYASLLNVKGTLYATTSKGGTSNCGSTGCGTVFSITTSGREVVLYRFRGPPNDGSFPARGGLIDVKGALFGTTAYGGAYMGECGISGCGTAFEVTL